MHPSDEDNASESGFDVGRHSAPCCSRLGEELAKVITDRLDLGPGSELTARVWGHGIVGMMHGAGDWWLRERPCSREQLVKQLADLLWGSWPRSTTARTAPASERRSVKRREAPVAQRPGASSVAAHGAFAAARSARLRRSPVRWST